MQELTEEMVVINSLGMHVRPAAKMVETVLPFSSEVHLQANGRRVNAKSIMNLLTLTAAQGVRVMVTCKGTDAQAAMDAVRAIFASGFGEE